MRGRCSCLLHWRMALPAQPPLQSQASFFFLWRAMLSHTAAACWQVHYCLFSSCTAVGGEPGTEHQRATLALAGVSVSTFGTGTVPCSSCRHRKQWISGKLHTRMSLFLLPQALLVL